MSTTFKTTIHMSHPAEIMIRIDLIRDFVPPSSKRLDEPITAAIKTTKARKSRREGAQARFYCTGSPQWVDGLVLEENPAIASSNRREAVSFLVLTKYLRPGKRIWELKIDKARASIRSFKLCSKLCQCLGRCARSWQLVMQLKIGLIWPSHRHTMIH